MIKGYTKKNYYTIPQGLQQESQLFQAVLRKVKKKKKKKIFSQRNLITLIHSGKLEKYRLIKSKTSDKQKY